MVMQNNNNISSIADRGLFVGISGLMQIAWLKLAGMNPSWLGAYA